MLAGVASGLAVHLGVDVAIVRIVIVVLTILTSGFGLIAYLLAALLIPEAEADGPTAGAAPPQAGSRDPVFWVGIGLLVVGVLWLLGGPLQPGGWLPIRLGAELVWPLVLIGFGLALWRAGDRRAPTAGAPTAPPTRPLTPPTPPARPASTTESPVSTDPRSPGQPGAVDAEASRDTVRLDAPTPPGPPVWSPPHAAGRDPPPAGATPGGSWTPPPAPEREGSILGRVTFGLALVAAGVLWIVDVATPAAIGAGRILAAALLVLGLGLLVGSTIGRARWLILPAALLLPLVLVFGLASPWRWVDLTDVDVRTDGVGDRTYEPDDLDELQSSYQIGAGSLTLDLTELDPEALAEAGTTSVSVQAGAGEILVLVPDDVAVAVTARSGAGELDLFGRTTGGLGLQRSEVAGPDGEVVALDLDVQVGLGQITVRSHSVARPSEDRQPDVGELEDDAEQAAPADLRARLRAAA
jgi:phage shock protein PspC (stress-responsive transcriptional regulator)/predicted membrane protein